MPSRTVLRAWLVLALALIACGWAAGAWAQVPEIAGKAADTFLSRGEYGALVVVLALVIVVITTGAGLVIRSLFNRLEALGERTIKALEDSATSDERTHELLQSLTRQLETRSATLGELSNLVSLNGTELRHGFGNVTQILEGILKALLEPRALALALADRIRLIWRNKGQGEDGE